MESKNNNQASISQQAQGLITEVKVYINQESGTLAHRAGDGLRIEMPINFYKSILNLPFQKKDSTEIPDKERKVIYGAIARPIVHLSKDGKYLIHRVFGTRIVKPVNYYKKILSAISEQVAHSA